MVDANATLPMIVRHLRLPTLATLHATHNQADPTSAGSTSAERELVIVELIDGSRSGWGECSALNAPTYTPEWAAGAYDRLTSGVAPGPNHPMADAALDMARLDLHLTRNDRSLAQHLGVDDVESVSVGGVVGLGTISETLTSVAALAATTERIKLKVQPGEVASIVRAVHDERPDLALQVDANGALTFADLDDLVTIAEYGVEAIEQPFAPTDLDTARELVGRSPIPVLADEAVATRDDAVRLWTDGALTGVVIKPPRLGGLGPALELLEWCRGEGVVAVAGGMLESGLGRHSLATFAARPGFDLVGDLSPARRWLADDPWPDLTTTANGRRIVVPTGPGIAPPPDLQLLERYTVRMAETKLTTEAATWSGFDRWTA